MQTYSENTFKKPQKRGPKINDRTGETKTNRDGILMKIIKYRKSNDIDIEFENNIIRKHQQYNCFVDGAIQPYGVNEKKTKQHVGETTIANNGLKMTIVEYHRANNVDIKFEDGIIVTNKTYDAFKKGMIKHPKVKRQQKKIIEQHQKQYVGQKNISNDGQEMTITTYRNYYDIDVVFKNGGITTNRTLPEFKSGTIRSPIHARINETQINKQGELMTIIKYRNRDDVDVQFPDGTIREHTTYNCFKKGLLNKQSITTAELRTEETTTNRDNLKMTIVAYRKSIDIDIRFADGMIKHKQRYDRFKLGNIGYPKRYQTLKIGQLAYHTDNRWAFYVKCEKCGLSDVMTYEQMQAHVCCQN